MAQRLTKRVLLLGWDAADWKFIHPLMELGQMPVLEKLIECGVSGKISTLHPVISPILWTSIATGKRADKHDILGFIEPSPDGRGARPVSSTSRRAKALWNILSQSGLRSSVVNWYASHPAEPISGNIFTNRFPVVLGDDAKVMPLDPNAVHPTGLREVAESLRHHPHAIFAEQLLPFFPEKRPTDSTDFRTAMIAKTLAECASTHNAATYLAAQDDWDLLAVYYEAIDHICHGFVEYHPPAMAHTSRDDAETYSYVVRGMYRFHDMLLGRLLDLAGPDTTVLLVSDHGFSSDHLRPQVAEHVREPHKKFSKEMNPVAWHRPQGIFVAAGKPLRRDELISGATLLDVAPTILALLGLPVPDDMDGRVLTNLFLEPVQIERIASYEEPHLADGVHRDVPSEESNPWAARQALEQLAALGYIELPEAGDPQMGADAAIRERRDNLAQVHFSTGRYAEALELLRELLAEREDPHLRCRVAMCLLATGRVQEAESVVEELLARESDRPLARLLLAQAKLSLDRPREALVLLNSLVEYQAQLPDLQILLGKTYLRLAMLSEAERAFRQALECDDDAAHAHDGLGVVLRLTGRIEDSIYEHMRAASIHHHWPVAHLHLGIALTVGRQFDWAIRAFTVASELAPENPLPHRFLARIYFSVKKDRAKARAHAARMLDLRAKMKSRTRDSTASTQPAEPVN